MISLVDVEKVYRTDRIETWRRRKGAGHLFAEAECGLSCDLLR